MKTYFVAPLLLILAGCQYDSLDKITQAAGIKVIQNGTSENESCLTKQMAIFDSQLSSLNREQRTAVEVLMKEKLTTIELESDQMTTVYQGIRSELFHVAKACNQNTCWWVEDAQRILKDEVTKSGAEPMMKATVNNKTLSLASQFLKNLSVEKKYYTTSVTSFANVTTLEQAISDNTIWNQPVADEDSVQCAPVISLNDLLTLLNKS